jgi:hypothetical protein
MNFYRFGECLSVAYNHGLSPITWPVMVPVAVDPQKRAKMLAQLRRGFHNDGLVV